MPEGKKYFYAFCKNKTGKKVIFMKIFNINPVNTTKTNFAGDINIRCRKIDKNSEALKIFRRRVENETHKDLWVDVYDMPENTGGLKGNLKIKYEDLFAERKDRQFVNGVGFDYDSSKSPGRIADELWENLKKSVPSWALNR